MFTRLESLRGLAAIMVVIYHSPFRFDLSSPLLVSNSYLFVDLFFVLSGFVMAYAYGEKIRQGMGFGEYLILRLGRLYPLHLFTLMLWVPYILVKQYLFEIGFGGTAQLAENNLSTLISNLLLVHALGIHDSLSWNHPSWSISTEFFAYIVFFGLAVSLDHNRTLWLPLAIAMTGYLAIYALIGADNLNLTYDFGLIRCISAFYVGVFLFRLRDSVNLDHLDFRTISLLEAGALTAVVVTVSYSGASYGMAMLAIVSFALSVFIFAAKGRGGVGRLLDVDLVRKIGVWSFSIYMTHRLIQFGISNIAEFVLGIDPKAPMGWTSVVLNIAMLVVIILASRQTYEWVEKPCRDWVKRRLQSRHPQTTPT